MKRAKKVLAMILSLAMVMAMSMTAFATTTTTTSNPNEMDSANVIINSLSSGDTVTLYKIVAPKYDSKAGFTGYEVVSPYKIADISNPSANEITDIANQVKPENIATKANSNDNATAIADASGSVTLDMNVGMYLVLVTSGAENKEIVYNPMIVSVYYTKADGSGTVISGGDVGADEDFVVKDVVAYAKSSVPKIVKTIVNPGPTGNNKGNDVAQGDTISFNVVADVPSYSNDYTTVSYNIHDQLTGLENVRNIKVYLDNTNSTPLGSAQYTETIASDKKSFDLDFDSDYILSLAAGSHQFIVTYEATLSDDSGVNFDANDNTVTLNYSNDPTDSSKYESIDDKTYHYTFSIDGTISGQDSYNTGEFIKTDEGETVFTQSGPISINNPLAGAEFTLKKYTDANWQTEDTTFKKDPVTTDATGRTLFSGLDAGYYTIQETKAPADYSINTTVYYVTIDASYYDDGQLKDYSITIRAGEDGDAVKTSSYSATYEKNDAGRMIITDNNTGDNNTTLVKNTKLGSLPSTGGIGTTIFTIGGCIIMIIAAGLFFASRRKKAEN